MVAVLEERLEVQRITTQVREAVRWGESRIAT
jgi:hypothetical protein